MDLNHDLEPIGRALLLSGAWLLYFVLHSLLASLTVKGWVAAHRPGWMRGYRIAFNLVALLSLLPPLWMLYGWRSALLWEWGPIGDGIALLLNLAALGGFVWSLRWYDGSEFLGTRQWRLGIRTLEDQERFRISPLHRYVRHPWYSLGLVLVWAREMDLMLLVSALMITLYFALGSRLEERKLIAYHGERYRRYRERVPALVPRPWRNLSSQDAHALEAGENNHQ